MDFSFEYKAAKDLGYSRETLEAIEQAKTQSEVREIMRKARWTMKKYWEYIDGTKGK